MFKGDQFLFQERRLGHLVMEVTVELDRFEIDGQFLADGIVQMLMIRKEVMQYLLGRDPHAKDQQQHSGQELATALLGDMRKNVRLQRLTWPVFIQPGCKLG